MIIVKSREEIELMRESVDRIQNFRNDCLK
jgi:hypothetical protein